MNKKTRQALMNWNRPGTNVPPQPTVPPMPKKNEPKTIPQLLESIAEAMCNDYCKYPLEWDE